MNLFNKIQGQERAISILKNAITNDRLSNSYLFHGPEGVGKFTTALHLAMALNCEADIENRPCGKCNSCNKFMSFSHPDFVHLYPIPNIDLTETGEVKDEKIYKELKAYEDNKIKTPWKEFHFSKNTQIRIDSIRRLQHKISRSRNEARFKTFIIENADMMNIQAANAFLKTLEEPPDDAIIILTTSRHNVLLPTIISRCQQIPFVRLSKEIIEKELEEREFLENLEAKIYARVANGNMKKAFSLAETGMIESRKTMLKFIDLILQDDEYKIIEYIKQFKHKSQRSYLDDMLSHLIIWLSDIALYVNSPGEIINIDKSDKIEEFYRKQPDIVTEMPKIINCLEDMQYKIKQNVNPQLVLTNVYNQLRKYFAMDRK